MRHGNDPKTKNSEGNDGILLAAMRGYSRVATYLIQRGALNPRTTNVQGNNIIHEAAANGHSEIIELLLALDSQLLNAKN
mmetsp:Transcript_3302/g.444  ORF Transcript_3302/g.444 Transcript_3302/m.444 type:complete len:80 (-) Transcript_3302:514-753(-)